MPRLAPPRYVSLFLPTFGTDLLRRRALGPPETVILIVRTVAARQVVVRACAQGLGAGVRPGMALTQARALLPGPAPIVREHRQSREDGALLALARWVARRFTPVVATDAAGDDHPGMDGLIMDIAGCEHLFGGEPQLIARLERAIRALGFAARAAPGKTPAAAWARARYAAPGPPPHTGDTPLDDLPVSALRIPRATVELLARIGITRIAEVERLPRPSLAPRFGPHLLTRLDLALRTSPERLTPVIVPEAPTVERTFAGPTTILESITHAVRALLIDLCQLIDRQSAGARALRTLRLRLLRIDAAPIDLRIALSAPSRSPAHLWTLLREKVERANMGFGVEGLSITALRTGRTTEHQGSLLSGPPTHHAPLNTAHPARTAAAELIDTLAQRLGPE
ncbi:MAG: Y-family DNA polymerase, partial [Phycisphaerales bacterium]